MKPSRLNALRIGANWYDGVTDVPTRRGPNAKGCMSQGKAAHCVRHQWPTFSFALAAPSPVSKCDRLTEQCPVRPVVPNVDGTCLASHPLRGRFLHVAINKPLVPYYVLTYIEEARPPPLEVGQILAALESCRPLVAWFHRPVQML